MSMFWDYQSVDKLIDIWGNKGIQDRFDSTYRNSDIYQYIADRMNQDREPHQCVTWQQCRNKIKSLRCEYRRIKAQSKFSNNGNFVAAKGRFQFYDKLDGFMRDKGLDSGTGCSNDAADVMYLSCDDNDSDTNQSKHYDSDGGSTEDTFGMKRDAACLSNGHVASQSQIQNQGHYSSRAPQQQPMHIDPKTGPLYTGVQIQLKQEPEESAVDQNRETVENRAENTMVTGIHVEQQMMENPNLKRPLSQEDIQARKRRHVEKLPAPASNNEILEMFSKLEDRWIHRQVVWEEKIMKMQMDFQERMLKMNIEREDARRKDDREFQMQVMRMQMEFMSGVNNKRNCTCSAKHDAIHDGQN